MSHSAALVKIFAVFSSSSKTSVECSHCHVLEPVAPHNCCHNYHCCFFVCNTSPGKLVKSDCSFQSKDCSNFLCYKRECNVTWWNSMHLLRRQFTYFILTVSVVFLFYSFNFMVCFLYMYFICVFVLAL